MSVVRSLRCVGGVPAPIWALLVVACATGTPPGEEEDDGNAGSPGGGSAGSLGGSSAGSPGAGRGGAVTGGTPSGGTSGEVGTSGAGSGGKTVFGGSGGASDGSGGADAGAAGSMSGRGGGGGTSGKGGASGMGGTAGRTGGAGGTAGAGGRGGMPNGGAGGGCSNPVATLAHSESASVKSNACVEFTHNPTWSSLNVQFQTQKGSGLPIPYSYGSCATSGKGSVEALNASEILFKGNNPKCSLFVQFEGSGTDLTIVHYD